MRAWLKTWTVHRLCDLHTRLSLWQLDVEDWLERLDPTIPVPAKGCRTTAKMYWYDGRQVHMQVLKGRLIWGHERRFRERKAGR